MRSLPSSPLCLYRALALAALLGLSCSAPLRARPSIESAAAAAGGAARPLRTGPAPGRVMSLSLCTDALVLDLLPPSRITSVTYLAHQSPNRRLAAQAANVGTNHGTAEEVLAQAPDLVLAGTYSTAATRALLERLHVPLLVVPPANNFRQIRRRVRRVAAAVGATARANKLLARMDATLARVARNRPHRALRVADWSGDGIVPGRGSLFDAVLTAAGGINIAAPAGDRSGYFDVEQLLVARPDVLADAEHRPAPALKTETADPPLVRRLYADRRITYPALYVDECGLPRSANAALRLERELRAIAGTEPFAPMGLAP